ncbi:MAG: hypothetical protein AAFW66_00085 [Pseudomonadota bacterium]
MKLDKKAQRAHAAQLLSDELFNSIMDKMEETAINAAVYTKATEDAERYAHLIEVRSIRTLRSKLKNLAARGDTEAE